MNNRCDGDSKKDEDSVSLSSLLSEYRLEDCWRILAEDNDGSGSSSSSSYSDDQDEFQAEWDWLEQQLAARWARLDRIAAASKNNGNNLFMQRMRRRELQVAQQKRDELLLYYSNRIDTLAAAGAPRDKTNSATNAPKHSDPTSISKENSNGEKPSRSSWLDSIFDSLLFEMNCTLPAVRSLLFFNIFMICLFDLQGELTEVLALWTCPSFFSKLPFPDFFFFSVVFLVGCAMLRCTDLFWWLNDADYDCLKFDFHNRLRLLHFNSHSRDLWTRLLYAVHYYDTVRWLVYSFGYNFCYQVAQELFEYGEYFWNQSETALRYLPSNTFDVNLFQTLEDAMDDEQPHIASVFLCERTCQDEIDRREAAYEEMMSADQEYTERVLAATSYATYWESWVEWTETSYMGSDEAPPVFDPAGDLLTYLVAVPLCILILYRYGFKFWDRY